MHAYISQMTITTINRREEHRTITTSSHWVPDSEGHKSQDEIRCEQKATRQLATDIIYQIKGWGEKTTPLVMNQIFPFLFTAEGAWFTSGRGCGLVLARAGVRWVDGGRRLMLSVRLCLSTALRVLHHSFHGKCTETDYRRLERVRKKKGRGGGGAAAGPGFVVRRWAAEWAASKSLIMHTPTIATHYPPIYSLYLFTLAFSRFLPLHCCMLQHHFSGSSALRKKSFLSQDKQSNFSPPWILELHY